MAGLRKSDVAVAGIGRERGWALIVLPLYSFSTAFLLFHLLFSPLHLSPPVGALKLLYVVILFLFSLFFSGGLELLDLAGYAYDNVFL